MDLTNYDLEFDKSTHINANLVECRQRGTQVRAQEKANLYRVCSLLGSAMAMFFVQDVREISQSSVQ